MRSAIVPSEPSRTGAGKVRLGDVATYVNGYAFKPNDWTCDGKEIIRIQDLTGSSNQPNHFAGTIPGKYLVKNGDVLISWSASIGVYVWGRDDAWLNQHIFKVVFDKVHVDNRYFVHQVSVVLKDAAGSAHGCTMQHLTKPVFDALPFFLPPLPTQQRIADELDQLCALKKNAEDRLAILDQIVKSRFVEMFGTIQNSRYDVVSLDNLCEFIKDGTHQTPTYTDDKEHGYKFLSSKDVTSGSIDWTKIKYIPEELHKELHKRIAPHRSDILLAKNGTTGIAALVDTDEVFDIYVSLALLRFKPGNDVHYLLHAINSTDTKHQFDASLKGVGVPNLHLGEIKKTKIIVPPLAPQREFAAFVAEVDKSKLTLRETVATLDQLYRAKLQEYFG